MNIGDKIESELLDGTKIAYTLDNIDISKTALLDGTKIKYTLDNIDTSKTVLLDGTKMYDDCMFISEENIKK